MPRLSSSVRTAVGLGVAVSCSVVMLGTSSPSVARAATPAAVSVRVASFNIQSVSLDRSVGNQRPWRLRRAAVIAQVLGERVDVLGVQEANPSAIFASRLVGGANQYQDLKNGLNRAGGHYAVANPAPYNCVRATTTYHCVPRNRGASGGDRILYDTRKLALVRAGSTRYTAQGSRDTRFLAWAVLRLRSTGRELLVADTHLATGPTAVRRAQWKQLITRVNALRGGRPVVVVGDFNTHRMHGLSAEMLPAMKRAGYGDVLNQRYGETPIRRPRARSTVNGWLNTYNHLNRNVAGWSYEDRRGKAGYNIDWIFASNAVPVTQWKVVASYAPRTLRVRGVFPSDHNMVRATLSLR